MSLNTNVDQRHLLAASVFLADELLNWIMAQFVRFCTSFTIFIVLVNVGVLATEKCDRGEVVGRKYVFKE